MITSFLHLSQTPEKKSWKGGGGYIDHLQSEREILLCCVFGPAKGCSHRSLVEITFLCFHNFFCQSSSLVHSWFSSMTFCTLEYVLLKRRDKFFLPRQDLNLDCLILSQMTNQCATVTT